MVALSNVFSAVAVPVYATDFIFNQDGRLPESLYFFEYSLNVCGPRPLVPGYWALDKTGKITSRIVSSCWNEKVSRYEVHLRLREISILAHV